MNPWKIETSANLSPQQPVMTGRVVSAVVAPPAEMGARGPAIFASRGVHNRVNTSRIILEINANVPSSAPLLPEISTLERE